MINMQGYLASAGTDVNLVLGTPFEFTLDKTAYDSKVQPVALLPRTPRRTRRAFKPLGDVLMADGREGRQARLAAADGKTEPGVYVYRFLEKRGEPARRRTRRRPGRTTGPCRTTWTRWPRGTCARANTRRRDADRPRPPLHTASDADDEYKKVLQASSRTCRRTRGSTSSCCWC